MNQTVVLDSFALVALFHKEPGWERVRETLKDLEASDQKALLCLINWGEFYYVSKRRVGKESAQEVLALVEELPIKLVSIDDPLVKEAAEIKSDYPVSYADAFCIATALRSKAIILTNDPEFQLVQRIVAVKWLSKPRRADKAPQRR